MNSTLGSVVPLAMFFSGPKERKDYEDDDDDLIKDRNDDLNDGLHADDLDEGAVRGGV